MSETQDITASINALRNWIPVAEQLPDFDRTVWVYIPYVRQCEATRKKCASSLWGRAHFDGHDYWFWEDADENEVSDVTPPTHWMPLPAPPGE